MSIDKDAVVRLFSEKSFRPLTLPELEARLSVSEQDKPELAKIIDELVREGEIVALRGQRYGLPQKMNLMTGILQAHPNGYAFLVPEKPGERAADVFIGRNDSADAMHGDKVIVRIERTGKVGRPEGRVIRILERRVKRIVGEYQQGTGFGYVVPEEGKHLHHLYIPKGKDKRALPGQLVVAEISKYPEGNRDPEGEITRVLGSRKDPDVEREVILERYGLNNRFPTDVLTEAKAIPQVVDPQAMGLRVDLRALKIVTIDGESAKDFDDALAVERQSNGNYRLWVSIADVAHYVRRGTKLDKEAYERATSTYFTDAVVPMLPEALSNGICSLLPKVERLTMTAELELDSEGKLLNSQFYDSVIVSKERLTYEQVKSILVDRDEDLLGQFRYLEEDLQLMEELAVKLKMRREERGSLDFDLPRPDIHLDMEGNIEQMVHSERNIAHRLVEEFMLAANEAVAGFFEKEAVPTLFRCHDEPEESKVDDLRYFLTNLNLRLDHTVTPKSLQRVLRQSKDRPLAKLVNEVVLRTMKHAYYTPNNVGHFGLASESYLHFTSPIRRYPDLIVHRILKLMIERGGISERQREELAAELVAMAEHTSERERNSERAEREALAAKKVQYMQQYVGEEFDGFISGVTSFGFFVELKDMFVDGLVHISNLGDDYYEYHERDHELLGQSTKRTFRLADRVRVRVARVDLEKRHIDFALISGAEREPISQGQEQEVSKGRPPAKVAYGAVHPETGDGRGRHRRQQAPSQQQSQHGRIPQRTPRPEEPSGEERARGRGRGARRERPAPQRKDRKPAAQVRSENIDLEGPPPTNPEGPTVPPPRVTEAESVVEHPPATGSEQSGEGDGRRRRRRRGGRGRRRRTGTAGSEQATENTDSAIPAVETDQAQAAGGEQDAGEAVAPKAPATRETGEEQPAGEEGKEAAPARSRGRRKPADTETAVEKPEGQVEATPEAIPSDTRERETVQAPARTGRPKAPAPDGESLPVAEAPAEATEGKTGEGSEEAGHEGELAFVAKRRRRRRGGRSRRGRSGTAMEEGQSEGQEGEQQTAPEGSAPAEAQAESAPEKPAPARPARRPRSKPQPKAEAAQGKDAGVSPDVSQEAQSPAEPASPPTDKADPEKSEE